MPVVGIRSRFILAYALDILRERPAVGLNNQCTETGR
jgi:hypothetical protein